MILHAIRNHIIFEFIDKIDSNNQFTQTTEAGLHVVGHFDSSANQPRWAKVLCVGPDVDAVLCNDGCDVLIDALKWTEGVTLNGKKIWRTDDSHVLLYRTPVQCA